MRYTILSAHVFGLPVTVTCGLASVTFGGYQVRTADSIVASLNAAFAGKVALTRLTSGKIGISWAQGEAGPIDLSDSSLALYLGFSATTIANTVAISPNAIRGHFAREASDPLCGKERRSSADTAHIYGRVTDPGEDLKTTGSMGLWVHRRGEAGIMPVSAAALYAAADQWVRGPIEIIDHTGASYLCMIAEGWECAPELRDGETVTASLEVVRWRLIA
jgi:hypothetical protein